MSVPNQKRVIIGERTKRNRDNLYAMMNLTALREAMQNLKGSSLKMWLYFNKNQDKYEFELSRVDCKNWGIKKDSYYSAIEDLINRGYLLPVREGSNTYVFCETPYSLNPKEYISKYEIQDWENQNDDSESQIKLSENPKRNNTNNTRIIQNNTKATSQEIHFFWVLDKLFECNVYSTDDEKRLGELMESEYYWNAPAERIEQLSSDERKELEKYYQKYSKYIYMIGGPII